MPVQSFTSVDKESNKAEMRVFGTKWSKYTVVKSGGRSANTLRMHYNRSKSFYVASMKAHDDANPSSLESSLARSRARTGGFTQDHKNSMLTQMPKFGNQWYKYELATSGEKSNHALGQYYSANLQIFAASMKIYTDNVAR